MLREIKKLKLPDFISCLICAVLSAAPFLNGKFFLLSWFAFIPLFKALEGKSYVQAFLLSYFTGIAFWSITIYWLVYVTLAGQAILILYLALYLGFFGIIASFLLRREYAVIILPSLWVMLEYLRSNLFTGFPWALTGYSQYRNLLIIQIADLSGVWGVSFLVIMFNAALYLYLKHSSFSAGRRKQIFLLVFLLLAAVCLYGYKKVNYLNSGTPIGYKNPISVSVIQPSILQKEKWDIKKRPAIMGKYFGLTSLVTKESPDLIVWPEAALPAVLEDEPEFFFMLKDYVGKINLPLLFGSVTLREGFYYNSAILLSGDSRPLGRYDKLHLVPFGEYVPLRGLFKFLDSVAPIGDISRGKEYTLFGPPGDFGVLICFEDVFPYLARNFVIKGAGFLVNITNDAWFGNSPEAY